MLRNVASVLEACCKCFRDMLQAYVQNVSSVLDLCCKHFFYRMLHMFHTYVARICSKGCRCFGLMLE
jgi:hypothetical protein